MTLAEQMKLNLTDIILTNSVMERLEGKEVTPEYAPGFETDLPTEEEIAEAEAGVATEKSASLEKVIKDPEGEDNINVPMTVEKPTDNGSSGWPDAGAIKAEAKEESAEDWKQKALAANFNKSVRCEFCGEKHHMNFRLDEGEKTAHHWMGIYPKCQAVNNIRRK